MLHKLLYLGISLAILVAFGQADCNVCSADGKAACVSKTQYQNCTADAIPTGPVYTCPKNTYCTALEERCTSNEALVACSDCKKCDAVTPFTCTSPTTFGLCDGVNIVANIEYPCETGEVCVANIGSPCVPSINGTGATCSYYDATNVIGDFCTLKASTGRYPYPDDSSCLRYIYCFRKNSTWTGNTWQCPTAKPYFSAITFSCIKAKPSTCT
ncbi:uncharacterized protein [Drosophila takahashii]|uniref:uncharacterized protein n=1 Tax=Drosophila takahashii TaxID=29030 RepID=UPI001CF81EC1|nr:uncharacterized protein LOC108059297 [Drosophila takahashii]